MTDYIGRTKAIKKLQLTIKDFRLVARVGRLLRME